MFEFDGPTRIPHPRQSRRTVWREVEQRGAAVARKARRLYDQLLDLASQNALNGADHLRTFPDVLLNTLSSYPDNWSVLQAQHVVYFSYRITSAGQPHVAGSSTDCQSRMSLEHLLSLGLIRI